MPKFRVPREGEALLGIVSYGRGGPRETGGRLTPDQVEQICRTVQRVPEVMVKVLPRASSDFKAAGKHIDYIGRHGLLELETDSGAGFQNEKGMALLEEWDLDIDDARRQAALAGTQGRTPPKLIHKLMLSMPAGTPPEKVHAAVRNLAREEFWGQHRYALVLHTDEDHPHVHLVLKAVNEQGVRLNIKKATLRHWRSEFARNLRLLGVAANATERAVRGVSKCAKRDGIYRASVRGDSDYVRKQAQDIASELLRGGFKVESGKRTLTDTRRRVVGGWLEVAAYLAREGNQEIAKAISRFVRGMEPPLTEREQVARGLLRSTRLEHVRAFTKSSGASFR